MKTYSIVIPCKFQRIYSIWAKSHKEAWEHYLAEPNRWVTSEIDEEDVDVDQDLKTFFFANLQEEQP